MRLVLDRRARLWLRRLPRPSLYSAGEIALLALLAFQVARLIYAVVTPPGPIGAWRAAEVSAGGGRAVLAGFDPFHRLSASDGPMVVTALNLKLYGIRSDQASGRGSAIVGLPDGSQQSYAVGEEILPGVNLKAVAFDHVTIARGGADEQLYLDQSTPATPLSPASEVQPAFMPPLIGTARPGPPPGPAPAPAAAAPDAARALMAGASLSPRVRDGRIDGYILQPQGDGAAFARFGFKPGDVVTAIDGAGVGSGVDLPTMLNKGGGPATVTVERGGRTVPIVLRAQP